MSELNTPKKCLKCPVIEVCRGQHLTALSNQQATEKFAKFAMDEEFAKRLMVMDEFGAIDPESVSNPAYTRKIMAERLDKYDELMEELQEHADDMYNRCSGALSMRAVSKAGLRIITTVCTDPKLYANSGEILPALIRKEE